MAGEQMATRASHELLGEFQEMKFSGSLEFRVLPKLKATRAQRELPSAWGIQYQNGFPGSGIR
jgi:hypothetical protein